MSLVVTQLPGATLAGTCGNYGIQPEEARAILRQQQANQQQQQMLLQQQLQQTLLQADAARADPAQLFLRSVQSAAQPSQQPAAEAQGRAAGGAPTSATTAPERALALGCQQPSQTSSPEAITTPLTPKPSLAGP